MYYRKCSVEDLEKAMDIVNRKYDNNIEFKRLEPSKKLFTLKCKDSKKPGHRIHYRMWDDGFKKGISACWHVHGDFFDALFSINPNAYIVSSGKKITKEYGNWIDRNIGSIMYPIYHSKSCECK